MNRLAYVGVYAVAASLALGLTGCAQEATIPTGGSLSGSTVIPSATPSPVESVEPARIKTVDPFDESNPRFKGTLPLKKKTTLTVADPDYSGLVEVVTRDSGVSTGRTENGLLEIRDDTKGQTQIAVSVNDGPWDVYVLMTR